ncbi:hypothetical protein [Neobacillus thermocopriae]|nr:hypothetical protein [Neobacillus thermocopriae]MED3624528.1 hypothetical protein [Neobacillus thermocopriae]MED3712921.1 hypothetical protein [Neobacillus thermocopriae]
MKKLAIVLFSLSLLVFSSPVNSANDTNVVVEKTSKVNHPILPPI